MNGGVLSASIINGEGKIILCHEFRNSDYLFQKDILKDWIHQLTEYYDSFDVFGNPTVKG